MTTMKSNASRVIGGLPQTNEHVPIYHKLIHKKVKVKL